TPSPSPRRRRQDTAEAFFFSSRRRHTRLQGDWSSDVCSSDLDGEDLLGLAVGALLRLVLQLPSQGGSFAAGFVLEAAQQLLLCLLRGEAGEALEARLRLGFLGPERALPVQAGLLPAPEVAGLGLEARRFLLDLGFASLDVAPPPRHLSVPRLTGAHQLFFRGEDHPLACLFQEARAVHCGGPRR